MGQYGILNPLFNYLWTTKKVIIKIDSNVYCASAAFDHICSGCIRKCFDEITEKLLLNLELENEE